MSTSNYRELIFLGIHSYILSSNKRGKWAQYGNADMQVISQRKGKCSSLDTFTTVILRVPILYGYIASICNLSLFARGICNFENALSNIPADIAVFVAGYPDVICNFGYFKIIFAQRQLLI